MNSLEQILESKRILLLLDPTCNISQSIDMHDAFPANDGVFALVNGLANQDFDSGSIGVDSFYLSNFNFFKSYIPFAPGKIQLLKSSLKLAEEVMRNEKLLTSRQIGELAVKLELAIGNSSLVGPLALINDSVVRL